MAAKVLDANEIAQWYESRFPFEFVTDAKKVWTQFPTLKANPAANVTTARTNVSGGLAGIVQDLSQPTTAIRLTPVPGTNSSTWVAYQTFNSASSGRLDNWIQPQQIPQSDGSPSIGYAVALYDGNPASSGTLVSTTAGQTGTGVNKTVGWVWDYSNGLLFLSSDYRSSFTYPDLWVLGFRYVGDTVEDLTGSIGGGSLDSAAQFLVNVATASLPNARRLVTGSGITLTDDSTAKILTVAVDQDYVRSMFVFNDVPSGVKNGVNVTFTLSSTPFPSGSLMFYVNGVLQMAGSGSDYTLSGSTVTMTYAPRSGANLLAWYSRQV